MGSESDLRDLARLAIAAFGKGQGSGVLGVDVQRIRRALGPADRAPAGAAAGRPAPRRHLARPAAALRAGAAARARARPDRAQSGAAAEARADRPRPLAAGRPGPGSGRRAPGRRAAAPAARLAGPRAARPQPPRARRRAGDDARLAADRRRAGAAEVPAAAAAATRAVRAVRRLDLGHQRQHVLPEHPARAARRVPQAALVRVHRAHLRGHRGLPARARLPRRSRRDRA